MGRILMMATFISLSTWGSVLRADWIDTFTGGFEQTWDFSAFNVSGGPPSGANTELIVFRHG